MVSAIKRVEERKIMTNYVIVFGSAFSKGGYQFVGPYDNMEEAVDRAGEVSNHWWQVHPLTSHISTTSSAGSVNEGSWILAAGNCFDGITLYGPFTQKWHASTCATDIKSKEWRDIEMVSIEKLDRKKLPFEKEDKDETEKTEASVETGG